MPRATGLVAAATVMAGTTVAFRILQGNAALIEHDNMGSYMWDGLAWTSSLGVAVLGASAGAAWPVPLRYRRQQTVRLGVASGVSLVVGAAAIVASRLLFVQSVSGVQDPIVHSDAGVHALSGFHAFGDLAVGLGAGLASAAIRRRVSLRPSLAGMTLSGQF